LSWDDAGWEGTVDEWDAPRSGDLGGSLPEDDLPTRRSARRVPMPARRAGPPAQRRRGPSPSRLRLPLTVREPVETTGPTDVIEELPAPPPPRAAAPAKAPPPSRRRPGTGRRVAALAGYTALGLAALLVLGLTGYAWSQYTILDTSVHKSNAIAAPSEKKSLNGDTNILIMGLDSRLDENGKPLPQDIYNALHAGDDSVGGFNANVLMLLHVPAHGRAVEISIPRDDYVNLPGCPDKECKEKIKQAYGLARDQAYNQLRAQGLSGTTLEQAARDAGRKEEVDTVSQFLGGVAIDHFVEVTLVAFFQIAQVVQPITVCLQQATHDTFSGADFPAGQQQINASQALAFVRQRRDTGRGDVYFNNFTDLDRERRQQAFISSLAYELRQAGTFTSPSKISAILSVAKQNTAIDSGLDLLQFAQEADNLTGGNLSFNTLPVDHFANLGGSIGDVNIVNPAVIQTEVHQLLTPTAPTTTTRPTTTRPTTTSTAPVPAGVVDVVNRSGQNGVAGNLERDLIGRGYAEGVASTQQPVVQATVVQYSSSTALAAADAVAQLLGGAMVARSSVVPAGHVRVVLGRDYHPPTGPTPTTTTSVPLPAPNTLTAPPPLSGGSIPCVK
jgi:LCP family protein required for cell wall assembly